MHGRKILNRHAALMNRMAQVLGVNLTEMMIRSQLSGEEWREAVVRCVGCTEPETCLHWLAIHPDTGPATGAAPSEVAPEYCANREMMEELRNKLAAEDLRQEGILAEVVDGGN